MINYTERLTLLMQDIVTRVDDVVVHRHGGRAGVRAAGPHPRRRRVRHLSLPHAAAERARLLLLARSRHRPHHAPIGMVRHQVADRVDRRAPDQIHDFVRAAAVLRSVARPLAEGTLLSRRRPSRGWRSSTRSSTSCTTSIRNTAASAASIAATAPTRPTATAPASSSEVAEMVKDYLDTRPDPSAARFPAPRLRGARNAARRRRRHQFRTFPSYPQRYIETLSAAAFDLDLPTSASSRSRSAAAAAYSEDDLHVRHFTRESRSASSVRASSAPHSVT